MPFQPFLPFEAETAPTSRLIENLGCVCREHPLEEKILVAPSLAIGHQLLERLAREGHSWINLRVETVRTLASRIAGPELAREGLRVLSRAQALALVEQSCIETLGPDDYFGRLRERPGLHRALHATLDELRAAGLSAETLPAGAFSEAKKSSELREILRRFAAVLETGRYVDGIEVLRRAARLLEKEGPALPEAIYILPDITELSALERRFLERCAGERWIGLASDPPDTWNRIAGQIRLFRAVGEENEIREVFRRILREEISFDDVEILHSDASVYPSLAWELSREQEIDCTFASGVSASYTRPGRAALAFLDWIGQDFDADILREALSSGALTLSRPESGPPGPGPGARAAARALRDAGIGWGRDRHGRCLDRLVATLERPEEASRVQDELTQEQRARRRQARARRLEAARAARDFARRAIELAPRPAPGTGNLRALATATRTFVSEFARVSDELDATARYALEALFEEFAELVPLKLDVAAAVERLRDAVASLSIAADRPRPGRVHVAFYRAGGFSGRRHTFVVGLDEARVPGRDLEDPVLLDEERRRINDALAQPLLSLGRDRPHEAAQAFRGCVARLRGGLDASYSSFDLRNLSQAGEPAPCSFFLDLYRAQSGIPEADYHDLAAALPQAAGFAPGEESALDDTEWWLSRLAAARASESGGAFAPTVRAVYPWLEDGHRAEEARESEEFTIWDGWIPSGAPELDPRLGGEPFSPSRVQSLARCPFAYFVRHVLRVEPPEDLELDATRWLDPLGEGSLLHEVFKDFFEAITDAGEKPEVARHLELILEIAETRIAAWRDRIPPRSELAFAAQRESIRFACRTLLSREEEHCREVTPRYFEVAFGLKRERSERHAAVASLDPVEIDAGGGKTFLLRGSIDRVDEAGDGTFHVWDYKTGATGGIREGAGLRGGRQIQPALYAMAFETLLERANQSGRVSKAGYFFPGRKGEGQRLVSAIDRGLTRDVLGCLFDLVAAGKFPHALSAEDCRFCDFESICGGARRASERAKRKLEKTGDDVLAAFRKIHAEEDD